MQHYHDYNDDILRQIMLQVGEDGVDDLVFTCGSGGTAAGLSIANYLLGSPFRYNLISKMKDY